MVIGQLTQFYGDFLDPGVVFMLFLIFIIFVYLLCSKFLPSVPPSSFKSLVLN